MEERSSWVWEGKPWAAFKNTFCFAAWIMVALLNGIALFDVVAAQTSDRFEDLALVESLRKGGYNSIHKPPAQPVRIEKVLPLPGAHRSLI